MTRASVFLGYSHKDEKEKDKFITCLGDLLSAGLIDLWSDDRISADADWEAEFDQAIAQAQVAILLISADFLNSDFILREVVHKLLDRCERTGLVVYPVIAKACAWRTVDWLARMEIRPTHGKPVWSDGDSHVDQDLAAIAEEIASIVVQTNLETVAVSFSDKEYRSPERDRRGLVGKRLGNYRVVSKLGRGGMADVFKAFHPKLERYVAIKTLHSHLVDDENFIARFEREAAAVARLRHPNIVQVYDFDSEAELPYMVMEFIEGSTLEAELAVRQDQDQLFSLTEIAQIFRALSNAIEHAHSQNMIHRDLKPGNVMLTTDGRVVLTDFGIARIIGDIGVTATGAIIGTPYYMSPEQGRGVRGDARVDIYALGVILFKLVTGRVPFEAETRLGVIMKHVNDPVPPPTAVNPDVPEPVERIILKALNKAPDDRYQSAKEMANALFEAIGELSTETFGDVSARDVVSIGQITILSKPSPASQETIDLLPDESDETVEKPVGTPFQVPPDVTQFVGRTDELDKLRDILSSVREPNIYCLTGMGGIGKTALATRLAYLLRDHFVDGVLWADVANREPLAILDSWAYAFGYDFSGLPDLESRAVALRSELTNKKILMILDDVWSVERVRPLLPSGSQSTVLLTTRDLDLVTALGAFEFPVSQLTPLESRQLLIRIVGNERVTGEEGFADEICQVLGHLPLAVKIAARRLVSRRRWGLATLAERLHDEKNRLEELKLGDREVRASFAISWEELDQELQRIFALLAVFEGRLFRASAVAAVAEIDRRTAEDNLYTLVTVSLVSEEGERHFRQHPLLADFAREQLEEEEPVYAMMALYYLDYATKHQHNYLELEQEWDNLLAGIRVARQREMWVMLIEYTEALAEAWFARGRFSDMRQGYRWACEAAEVLDDRPTLATNLHQWGRACIEQGDYNEAKEHLALSLQIYRGLDDQSGIAAAQYSLGRIAVERGNYDEAQQLLKESQRIREQLGDVGGVAETIYQQVIIQYLHSNFEKAETLAKQALDMQQSTSDKLGCIRTLGRLANIAIKQDDYDLGEQYCQQALVLCEEIQEQGELAIILYVLAEACRQRGDLGTAREHAERSLTLLARMGDRKMQAIALWRLSMIDADLKDYDLALEEGLQSLSLHRELEDNWGLIYTLLQLGDIHQAVEQPGRAHERWSQALSLAEGLEHPLTEPLRVRLDPKAWTEP